MDKPQFISIDTFNETLFSILKDSEVATFCLVNSKIVCVNNAFNSLLGYSKKDNLINKSFLDFIVDSEKKDVESLLDNHEKNSTLVFNISFVNKKNESLDAILTKKSDLIIEGGSHQVFTLTNVIEDDIEPSEIPMFSQYSLLAGFHNRQNFLNELSKHASISSEINIKYTLIVLAIDNLAVIINRLGFDAGKKIVSDISSIIQSNIKKGILVCRFSIDLFAILIDSGDLEDTKSIAETIRKKIEAHIWSESGQNIIDTCSLCVYSINGKVKDASEIIQQAESSCRHGQIEGGNKTIIYPDSEISFIQKRETLKRIKDALIYNRFKLFYQPVAPLHGQNKETYEVLLRMYDIDNTLLFPKSFLTEVVNYKHKNIIDRWVIKQSIRSCYDSIKNNKNPLYMIKLSDEVFKDKTLVEWLKKQIVFYGVKPDHFVFEINGKKAIEQIEQAKTLIRDLKNIGIKTVFTHYGRDINTTSILTHFKTEYVKIDSTIIHQLPNDISHQKTTQNLIDAAHNDNRIVIADYVEDAKTLALLWRFKADYASGYYIQIPTASLEFNFSFTI